MTIQGGGDPAGVQSLPENEKKRGGGARAVACGFRPKGENHLVKGVSGRGDYGKRKKRPVKGWGGTGVRRRIVGQKNWQRMRVRIFLRVRIRKLQHCKLRLAESIRLTQNEAGGNQESSTSFRRPKKTRSEEEREEKRGDELSFSGNWGEVKRVVFPTVWSLFFPV